MAFDEQLAGRVRKSFSEKKVAFEEKRMMGGLCFLVNDKMCVGVEKERLMIRLDPEIYEHVLTRKGCSPMDFTGRPLRGFVFVHANVLGTRHELESWLEPALEFNPRAKSSKKRTPRRSNTRTDRTTTQNPKQL